MKETTKEITPHELVEKTGAMIEKLDSSIKKLEKNLSAAKKRREILKARKSQYEAMALMSDFGVDSMEDFRKMLETVPTVKKVGGDFV